MPDEIMPEVEKAWPKRRTLRITNIRSDRHTDRLSWVPTGDDGDYLMELSEAQVRDLYRKLSEYITEWDGK